MADEASAAPKAPPLTRVAAIVEGTRNYTILRKKVERNGRRTGEEERREGVLMNPDCVDCSKPCGDAALRSASSRCGHAATALWKSG
jgi:hypothetical protein